MNVERHPISIPEKDMLLAWLSSKEANLFRDLVRDEMEAEYFQAVKSQSQASDKPQDVAKFNNQAAELIKKGDDIRLFLQVFSKFSSPDYKFHRLKQT